MWSREIDELGMINQSEKGSTCARVFKIILITFMSGILVSYNIDYRVLNLYSTLEPEMMGF